MTGYITYDSLRKTTNGGLNWVIQMRPKLNYDNSFTDFSLINKDTIWGSGGSIITTLGSRGIIYKTTNGGQNWGYQIPDTININANRYYYLNFLNKNIGWAHHTGYKGIHTLVGGNDTTFYTNVNNNSQQFVSNDFILYQNYPNPFNSMTNVKVQMLKQGFAEVKLFDLTGRLVKILLKQNLNTGTKSIKFDLSNLSSGVYFYTLFIDGIRIDTKKMALIK